MAKNIFLFDDDDDSPLDSAKNPFLESSKARSKRQETATQVKSQQLKTTQKNQAKKKKDDDGNIIDKGLGIAGNFIKEAAIDVKDTAVGAVKGVKDTIGGEVKRRELEKVTAEMAALNKERGEYTRTLTGPEDYNHPDIKKKLEEFRKRTDTIIAKSDAITTSKEWKAADVVDAKKTAFQGAETALNVGTLGLGTPIKALIKQGGKVAVKKAVQEGGDQVAKQLAQEVLEKSAKRKLAESMGKDAALGAGYGITQTGKRDDKNDPEDDPELQDYLLNVAFGAGVGAAIPVVGAGLKKGAQKTVKAFQGTPGAKIKAPATDDVNGIINQAIDEQSDKYGTGVLTRVKNWVGDQVDPNRAFAKVDDKFAKTNKIPRNKLNSDESVEDLARRSAASEREAAGLFDTKTKTGQSASDLIKKYAGDSEQGKEFNNYTNAKFDLEFRAKNNGKKQIQNGLTTEQLEQFVKDYEAKNADALTDLATKKQVNDMAVDYMVKSKAISQKEGDLIKNSYENAVPLERVFPDDLARPQVTGKNIGSIAKQTVIQKLEGGSDIPLSNSFDTMLNRVYKAVSQGNRAKLAQKLLERQEQGLIEGGKVVVTAGNKEARKAAREDIKLVNRGVRHLSTKVGVSNRQMRKIASEINKLQKEGLNLSLKEGGKNPLPNFTPEVLGQLATTKGKNVGSRAFFKSLIEADPGDLARIRNKVATREPKLAMKLDEIAAYRTKIDSLKAAKTELKNITAEFTDDPTTGKQIISGIIDGESYKMEVPPDLAKAVMGLDSQKLPSVLKALALVKKPFEVAWTGILNPVFSAVSFSFYDTPMSIINSPQGFKTLAPKAVIESVKSLRNSSEFQKRLAAEGARPYGGSGASAFIRPDAKSIAAQRNILSNLKYTASHVELGLSKTDVWGGKLANMTRTRVARAAYDDALKMAKKEGKDIKDIAVQKRAMENAALAYRTIMPDYDTMSHLTRQINSVVPFYAASVAGTRSFGKALKRDPAGTSAKALALGIVPTIGVTAFSLMQPAGQEFYKDMEASGSKQTLDNNMIVVLPGAHKNKETGEWTGIVKVPLAPEFRAINQTTWRAVRGAMGGDGPGASQIALSLFDAVTGGVRTSENPMVTTQKILSGQDPRTGEQIIKGQMANLPKEEQVYDSTSPAGKAVAKVFKTSPIQGDKLLSQFGLAGQTAKNGGKPVEAISENVKNRATGAYGERAADAFYRTYSPIKARRDKTSKEITSLIKQGRVKEATRKANEFNETLSGRFADVDKAYGGTEGWDENWDDMLDSLAIKTSKKAFKSRYEQ